MRLRVGDGVYVPGAMMVSASLYAMTIDRMLVFRAVISP
jgi:hypothetical protein